MEKAVILDTDEKIEVAHALLYKADKYIDMVARTRAEIEEYGADEYMTDESTYGEFLKWVMGQLRIIRTVLDKIDYTSAPVGWKCDELGTIWMNLEALTPSPIAFKPPTVRRDHHG